MKIRLRYELWEHLDGLSFRRASKAANLRDRNFPEGRLRQVFYASSEAEATAQYHDLRGITHVSLPARHSHAPFTRADLEAQIAEFPADPALAAQIEPRLHPNHLQPEPVSRERRRGWAGGGRLVRRAMGIVLVLAVLLAVAVFVWPGLGRSMMFDQVTIPKALERVFPEP